MPVSAEYFPAGQRIGVPAGQNDPAGQSASSHPSTLEAPVRVEYFPAGQRNFVPHGVPAGQNEPAGQSASQSSRRATPVSVEYLPAGHG